MSINTSATTGRDSNITCLLTCVLAMLLCGASGCASSARNIGAAAAPAAVRSGLQEANAADAQQQLQRLADSPAMQHIGQSVGEGVGIGLFNQANKLTGGDASASTATDAGTPVTASGAAGTGPTSQPTPSATGPSTVPAAKTPGASAVMSVVGGGGGLNGFVKSSVQEAFLAATNPQFKAGEKAMSEAIGEGFVSGMITVVNKEGPALGDMIRKELGPIMQDVIREQIAPAVRDMLQQQLAPAALQVWREGAIETLKLSVRPDLQPDIEQNAANISLGASHGTHQALVDSGFLNPAGYLPPHIRLYLWVAAAVVAIIAVALLSLLMLLNLIALHHWRHRNKPAAKA